MKHLVVTECFNSLLISDTGNQECLTSLEADELAAYVIKHDLEEDGIQFSRNEITFINYVGFIQLRSCSIEILPKVSGNDVRHSRQVLLRMLQRSGFLNIHESQVSQLMIEKMNLFEIIASLFTEKLALELRKGVFKTYQREYGELHLVRGKINMNRQLLREAMMQPGVSCIYDEFQIDNPLNQAFRAALQIVMSQSKFPSTKKRAMSSEVLLDEVDSRLFNYDQLDRIRFDRTNVRFQDSFQLAKLLVGRSAPVFSPGRNKNSSILFKMNDLFEAYIAYLVRKNWDEVTVKDRSYKLLVNERNSRGVFQLEPDLLVARPNGKQIIIDTKWKMIHSQRPRHGVKREDFYQMYAYLTRYKKVTEVVLLYPHHDGIASCDSCLESWHLEGESGKKIKVYSIQYENEQVAESELRDIVGSLELLD
ncbi:McrC family protein [Paenibacillus ihuae]|uniref:McrC family protein n=1 Tax=Paenibacillus ihuae TaxID=1232431 RepID=UPI0006D57CAA|nr:McrC family protein [Paenibacillus ihuae]